MRPYRRLHHSSWRVRGGNQIWIRIRQYLAPFICDTKSIWDPEPPFPPSMRMLITIFIWFALLLPLLYLMVPPILTVLTLQMLFKDTTGQDAMATSSFPLCENIRNFLTMELTEFDKNIMNTVVKAALKKIGFKFSLAVAIYDYVQTFRAIGFC